MRRGGIRNGPIKDITFSRRINFNLSDVRIAPVLVHRENGDLQVECPQLIVEAVHNNHQ